jgi:hypothetical protein
VGLDVFYDRDGTRFGLLDGRLLLQSRAGLLTDEALDAVVTVMEERMVGRSHSLGLIAVVEESARRTSVEIQTRQRMHMGRFLDEADGWICSVTRGDGVEAMSMRAVGHVLLLGHPRVAHFSDVETAAVWMAAKLGELTPVEIVAGLDTLRARPTS